MNKFLRTASSIALLLAIYYIFQLAFVMGSTWLNVIIAAAQGNIPADAAAHINDAQYLAANPAVNACLINGRALGLFLSSLGMLLLIHFTGHYRLSTSIFRSISRKLLFHSTLLVFTAMLTLNIFVQWFPLEDNLESLFDSLSHNVLGIISMALLAPLLEEVLFRGAIQGILMRHFGKPWPAIIVASLIFGIFHWNPIQVVYATLLGMVLGWIYYRTGSLLSVIVGHVLNNSIAVFTTIAFGAAEEEEIANSSPGIAAFVFFAVASIALALKVKAESCE
jgi:membrane protease YdiL (CAAX protease family)